MFNRTQALTTHEHRPRGQLQDALGAAASVIALVVVAAAAPLLIQAAPDGLDLTRWLILVALAQPGMMATWAILNRRLALHAEGHRTLATNVESILMVAASLSAFVFVIPFVMEIWLWA